MEEPTYIGKVNGVTAYQVWPTVDTNPSHRLDPKKRKASKDARKARKKNR